MHEMALVRRVLGISLEEAEKAGANRVTEVYLRIGCGRDIVIEFFSGLFDYLAEGTIAEGAELVYERVPMVTKCNDCGAFYQLDVHNESTWPCPKCGSRNYSLFSGMEFSIDRIELAWDAPEGALGEREVA